MLERSISRRGFLRTSCSGLLLTLAGCTDGRTQSLPDWQPCPAPPSPSEPVDGLLPQPQGDWLQLTTREPPQLDAEDAIQAQYRGPFNGRHIAHVSRWPRIRVHEIRQDLRAGAIDSFDIWVWREQYMFAAKTRDSVRQLPALLGLSPALTRECVIEQGESRSHQLEDQRRQQRELQ